MEIYSKRLHGHSINIQTFENDKGEFDFLILPDLGIPTLNDDELADFYDSYAPFSRMVAATLANKLPWVIADAMTEIYNIKCGFTVDDASEEPDQAGKAIRDNRVIN